MACPRERGSAVTVCIPVGAKDTGHWDTELVDREDIYIFRRAVALSQVSELTCQIRKHTKDTRSFPFINLKREKIRSLKYKKSNCRWYKYKV